MMSGITFNLYMTSGNRDMCVLSLLILEHGTFLHLLVPL